LNSSPEGWNTFNGNETDGTIGNNAIAFIGDENGIGGQSAPGVFDFNLQLNQDPREGENQNAALTNAFFVANTVHDIFYQYGFTESAFNFQQSNFGKGGAEGDAVQISVQDNSGTDNAQFTTPPDGLPGQMEVRLRLHFSHHLSSCPATDVLVRFHGSHQGRCNDQRCGCA
jgi:extracellular elastinolytic metalloproteinase